MIVSVDKLRKSFSSKPVLNDISFNVEQGDIFAIVGPNGAGKTTTLRCIFGEIAPEGGELTVFGEKVTSRIKEKIAVMTEDRLTFRRFLGEDYLRMWRMLYPGWREKVFASFAVHYKFNLNERVETYSMGMKTLFHIALTVASGADLLILDEPTQSLDPVIRQEVMGVLRDYVLQEGKTMIISSHEIYDLEEIAGSFAVVLEGKVLYSDTIDGAKETHRIIPKGQTIPSGEIIGVTGEETLVRTDEEAGRFPNFKEIVLCYLQSKKAFAPFEEEFKPRFKI
ncbi:multidrug ABC transporter ATPase [Mesotoga sp. H07pep.5.4]|uniref:ABC transporter ATP-binding protein n=1 Tax=Mesotoga sp. H07pep.5.4 TaxID=1463664 RepID=UPI000EF16741|nr:ABC transporter ATP-binding protein [Mesotoga sp. H07pep.5.4]RLL86029.1 multidrug ABC transporter ATPase [Mesotoga sp. H07pep.5.4]